MDAVEQAWKGTMAELELAHKAIWRFQEAYNGLFSYWQELIDSLKSGGD